MCGGRASCCLCDVTFRCCDRTPAGDSLWPRSSSKQSAVLVFKLKLKKRPGARTNENGSFRMARRKDLGDSPSFSAIVVSILHSASSDSTGPVSPVRLTVAP